MTATAAQVAGQDAESAARRLLERAGLDFVAANVCYKVGEIDLVMRDGDSLVFVEVRARRSRAFGGAAASIGHRKQERLRRAAQCYLLQSFGQRAWPSCRFDAVVFDDGSHEWIRDAFGGA